VIDQRLFDWYNIDTKKNLGLSTYCPRPYDTVLIDKQGSCYLCECTSWLPQSVGNLHKETLSTILNSAMSKKLRESIENGSYQYCNNKQCTYLLDKRSVIWPKTVPVTQIKNVRLAIDNSCNLKCPSCRRELIFVKKGREFERRIKLADQINEWLNQVNHSLNVHIGSDGDPFASYVYRHFMANAPIKDNIKYSLLTNGLMFKEFSQRIPHITHNLKELGISIDGASKETYEKLRLGSSWEKINANLKFIAELKKKNKFIFRLHFVVQKDNYHEMEKIIELGKHYNADHVWLNKIENWNVMNNFKEQNIFTSTDYKIYLQKVKKIINIQKNDFVECPTLID